MKKQTAVASLVGCGICTHIWAAVRPINTLQLECPHCHHMIIIEEL